MKRNLIWLLVALCLPALGGVGTLTNRSTGQTITSAFFNDIHGALDVDFVGRNSSGVATAGQSLGTSTYPWGAVYTQLTSGNVCYVTTNGLLTSETSLAISRGGTGQASKVPAFDALQPMTASGDIIYGGTSGTGTRLAKGADGTFLKLVSGLPSWTALNPPTIQRFLSGSGTWSRTSANAYYLIVEMVGGGGGGSGSGTVAGTLSTAAGDTTFGGSTASAGTRGPWQGAIPTGGTCTIDATYVTIDSIIGGSGGGYSYNGTGDYETGSDGGASYYGGAGRGGGAITAGSAAAANTGAGGGGGGTNNTNATYGGQGGSAGGFCKFGIANPASTYSYGVGAAGGAGAAGTNGNAGAAGAAGKIITFEYAH